MTPNWTCSQCKAYNHPRRRECWQCGSSRTEETVRHRWYSPIIKKPYISLLIGIGVIYVILRIALFVAAPLTLHTAVNASPTSAPTPRPTYTPIPTPTVGPPEIAKLETLDSYRLQLKISIESGDAFSKSIGLNITREWVKKSQAEHTTIDMEGMPGLQAQANMETITISNTAWFKMRDAWTRVDFQQAQRQRSNLEGLETYFQNMKPAGREAVNNIQCNHYTVEEDIMKVSGADNGNMTVHAKGDIWIADQSTLPPVAVRMRVRMGGLLFPMSLPLPVASSGTSKPKEMIYDWQYDVTNINTSIAIEPPK